VVEYLPQSTLPMVHVPSMRPVTWVSELELVENLYAARNTEHYLFGTSVAAQAVVGVRLTGLI